MSIAILIFLLTEFSIRLRFKLLISFNQYLREQSFNRFFNSDVGTIISNSKGMFLAWFDHNIYQISNGINHLFNLIRSVIMLLGYIIIVTTISSIFGLILLSVIFLNLLLPLLFKSKNKVWVLKQKQIEEDRTALNQNFLEGFQTVLLAGKQQYFKRRFLSNFSYFFNQEKRIYAKQEMVKFTSSALTFAIINSLVILVAVLVYLNYVSFILYIVFGSYAGYSYFQCRNLQTNLIDLSSSNIIYKDLVVEADVLGSKKSVSLPRFKILKLSDVSVKFTDKNLSFNYLPPILAGKKYAIVAPSGTGKTTLLRLIMGWIKPTSGSLKYNREDYSNISLESLAKKINFVSGDFLVFEATIRDNLTLFNMLRRDERDLEDVLNRVGLSEFKLDDIISNDSISQGQRQRISIARVILNPKEILLLDEALSNLDKEIRRIIEEIFLLDNVLTFIYVTHSLEREGNFDKVIELKHFMGETDA